MLPLRVLASTASISTWCSLHHQHDVLEFSLPFRMPLTLHRRRTTDAATNDATHLTMRASHLFAPRRTNACCAQCTGFIDAVVLGRFCRTTD